MINSAFNFFPFLKQVSVSAAFEFTLVLFILGLFLEHVSTISEFLRILMEIKTHCRLMNCYKLSDVHKREESHMKTLFNLCYLALIS